jgi:hypothetical protein
MNRRRYLLFLLPCLPLLMAEDCGPPSSQERDAVDRQQTVYATAQPIPTYDYSLERDRITGLYNARMSAAATWSVWRSNTGVIEGDCPSSGYPLPYGVQLTAPDAYHMNGVTLPQAEPNGLFTNGVTTNGTWVFCVTDGQITPMYVESVVTAYPYTVTVDYEKNRVIKSGAATVTLEKRAP